MMDSFGVTLVGDYFLSEFLSRWRALESATSTINESGASGLELKAARRAWTLLGRAQDLKFVRRGCHQHPNSSEQAHAAVRNMKAAPAGPGALLLGVHAWMKWLPDLNTLTQGAT